MTTIDIPWRQQARQMVFMRACGLSHPWDGGEPCPPVADVIGYGGAAGGGKSDALLMVAIVAGLTYPGISAAYFRREYPQLEGPGGIIMRSHELLSGWATWHGGKRRWTLPTGSILEFCHAAKTDDVYSYQSQQFDLLLLDEATQFERFQLRYLLSRNRATRPGVTPFCALGTNPGGIGHGWFKQEFVDVGPPEQVHTVEVEEGQYERHYFVPALLSDNAALTERDPAYQQRLERLPEVERRQLLYGDWDTYAGQYYPEWRRDVHVVSPLVVPEWWRKFRALDYGLDCTACYWLAVDGSGNLWVYRELYQSDLNLSQAAERILELTPDDERISYTVASPDLWNRRQDRGKSGAETMAAAGLHGLTPADHRRVPGWRQLREWLAVAPDEYGEPAAGLRISSDCRNLIRTLPGLIHDDKNPEDVDDACEDHGPEALRYGIMSRPPRQSLDPQEQRRRARRRRQAARPVVSSQTGW